MSWNLLDLTDVGSADREFLQNISIRDSLQDQHGSSQTRCQLRFCDHWSLYVECTLRNNNSNIDG